MDNSPKVITIRMDHGLWVKLRRLQETGEIRSIQAAAIEGLQWVAFKRKKIIG